MMFLQYNDDLQHNRLIVYLFLTLAFLNAAAS